MRTMFFLTLVMLLVRQPATAAPRGGDDGAPSLRLLTWNVENLFHPSDDPATGDDEFTPDGDYRWTYSRFVRKTSAIAQTIAALPTSLPCNSDNNSPSPVGEDRGGVSPPTLIVMCEVEDDSTMVSLVQRSVMRTAGYQWLRTHGSDRRGINVALLYDPFRFHPVATREVRIASAEHGYRPTRNLLYVAGEVQTDDRRDTLHVIACHLPSQAGGTRQADRHRRLAAQTLVSLVDSILAASPRAAIVVTGDFNSDSRSRLMRSLRCGDRLRALPHDFRGTYRYRGDWSHLDHILCTGRVAADTAHVVRLPWLLEDNTTYGGDQPRRTFRGPTYHGGVSDHLPVFTDITLTSP